MQRTPILATAVSIALAVLGDVAVAEIEPSANEPATQAVSMQKSWYDFFSVWFGQPRAQLGPRPEWLVNDMDDSLLKDRLTQCLNDEPRRSHFSIGHRGAPLQFPEHTRESYEAAARMGAGILECDVSFTADAQLVCRHSQCDLHTTTNILATPLAGKCSQPFQAAEFDDDGNLVSAASAKCCTSD